MLEQMELNEIRATELGYMKAVETTPNGCPDCALSYCDDCDEIKEKYVGECFGANRSDSTEIIFELVDSDEAEEC